MPEPPVLLLRNATVIRGQAKVFDRLSLEVPAERNVAILGPNGAGKSTLLQLVTRDLYPTYDVDSRIEVAWTCALECGRLAASPGGRLA